MKTPLLASFAFFACAGPQPGPQAGLPLEEAPAPARLLVQGALRPIAAAHVWSVDNANTRYTVQVTTEGAFTSGDVHATRLEGEAWSLTCDGGSLGGEAPLLTFQADRAEADAAAAALGVARLDRRDPRHRLVLEVTPSPDAGGMVTAAVVNRGGVPAAFATGGRYRGAGRDNRFSFKALRGGEVLPDVGSEYDFGGLGTIELLEPGERWEAELDLTAWFALDRRGRYVVEATFALEIEAPRRARTPLPWPEGAEERWDDTLETAFVLEVR